MLDHNSTSPKPEILIIDDDATIRLLMRERLSDQIYTINEAENGAAGLEQIKASKPDLVLLDVNMPGINGFDVCAEIRRLYDEADISIRTVFQQYLITTNYCQTGIYRLPGILIHSSCLNPVGEFFTWRGIFFEYIAGLFKFCSDPMDSLIIAGITRNSPIFFYKSSCFISFFAGKILPYHFKVGGGGFLCTGRTT